MFFFPGRKVIKQFLKPAQCEVANQAVYDFSSSNANFAKEKVLRIPQQNSSKLLQCCRLLR